MSLNGALSRLSANHHPVLGLEMYIAMSFMGGLGIQTQILTLVHQTLYQLGHHPSLFWLVPALVTSGFSERTPRTRDEAAWCQAREVSGLQPPFITGHSPHCPR